MDGLRHTDRLKAAAFTAPEAVAGVTQPASIYAKTHS
jgi:hypothetical protein